MDARTTPLPPPAPAEPTPSTASLAAPTLPATDLPPPGTATAPPSMAPPQGMALSTPPTAPPSVGGLPHPEPGTPWSADTPLAPTVVEPVPVAPARRRWPLLVALGLLAVVALGVGAFVVFGGSGGDGDATTIEVTPPDGGDATDEAFSFAAATGQASEASSFRFDMTMAMPIVGEMRVDGAIDGASGRMSMSMDLGETAGELAGPDAPTGFEIVLDVDAGVMYYGGSMAEMFGDGSTPWVSFDLGEFAEMAGQSIDELRSSFVSNPADFAAMLDGLDAVEVGMDEIDGLPVKHYQVTVPVADVVAADPQLADQLSALPGGAIDDLVYDVWVTEDNQLRRLAFDMEVEGMAFSTVMNLIEVGEAIDIPLPDPAEVTEIDDLVGSLGGLGALAD